MKILFHPKAAKDFKKLGDDLRARFRKKLQVLENRPELGKRLKHSDFWSLRVGDHRVIYEIDKENKSIVVLFIGHRKKVYDDFSKLL